MLESSKDLTLTRLNEATQAWLELEYNRKVHSELGQTPIQRYRIVKNAGRRCPDAEALRHAFIANVLRMQRRGDGTVTIDGVRFEVPSPYRQLKRIVAPYASWDLARVYQADPHSGQIVGRLYPLDKHRNADGLRRRKAPPAPRRWSWAMAWRPCGANSWPSTPPPACPPRICPKTPPT